MNIVRNLVEIAQAKCQMNDAELARRAGISAQTLCAAKRGDNCKPVTAGKIAQALGVPVDSIIKKEGGNV